MRCPEGINTLHPPRFSDLPFLFFSSEYALSAVAAAVTAYLPSECSLRFSRAADCVQCAVFFSGRCVLLVMARGDRVGGVGVGVAK